MIIESRLSCISLVVVVVVAGGGVKNCGNEEEKKEKKRERRRRRRSKIPHPYSFPLGCFDCDAARAAPWSKKFQHVADRSEFSWPLLIAADKRAPLTRVVTPPPCPAGDVDLRAKGRRADQHRRAAPQVSAQLPRLARQGPGQLRGRPPQPVQPFHPDQRRPHERRGPLHLRVRHLPAWQRARHRVPVDAR